MTPLLCVSEGVIENERGCVYSGRWSVRDGYRQSLCKPDKQEGPPVGFPRPHRGELLRLHKPTWRPDEQVWRAPVSHEAGGRVGLYIQVWLLAAVEPQGAGPDTHTGRGSARAHSRLYPDSPGSIWPGCKQWRGHGYISQKWNKRCGIYQALQKFGGINVS